MLEDKKEAVKGSEVVEKKASKKAETKDYTILKKITLEKLYNVGSTVEVEIGSDLEKYLLTNKFISKHGISRSN